MLRQRDALKADPSGRPAALRSSEVNVRSSHGVRRRRYRLRDDISSQPLVSDFDPRRLRRGNSSLKPLFSMDIKMMPDSRPFGNPFAL
jgi:hypothetical protein